MKLDPTTARRVEERPRNHSSQGRKTYKVFVFGCVDCDSEIRVSHGQLYTASGKCKVCVRRTRPFQHAHTFLRLHSKHKEIHFDLSYDEFLSFTGKSCEYCHGQIPWEPWSSGRTQYSKGYYLDRKNSELGYTFENCVPCCTRCNLTKSDRFSFEEFLIVGKSIRKVDQIRKVRTDP